MKKKGLLNICVYVMVFSILAFAAFAAGEIVQTASQLNYWTAANHTVYIQNTGTASTNVTIAIPTGWTFTSGTNCVQSGTNIECILAGSGSGSYVVQSPGATVSEYTTDDFVVTTNNTYTGNNVSMLRIECSEIFHTLVEFGRGRGNYFYNSGTGRAGSGQVDPGCAYLPNGTFIELNFLHKIYNVKQYYHVVSSAENASYTCTYPNDTVVRQHLDTSIARSSIWTVDYFIDEVPGSWERFGYLGMQFDAGAYSTGQNITINCTNIQYYLPAAGGYMNCTYDSFSLQFRDREPFTVSASTTTANIGNGTQEVIITYNITNGEIYDVSDAIIEIEAPQYAEFIGTRGELWGYALNQYRIEKAELVAGQSELITLVARFNTTNAPGGLTALNLSEGVKIKYTTCWEANAYNPTEYIQDLKVTNTATVGLGTNVSITSVPDLLQSIYDMTIVINRTVIDINTTVTDIYNISKVINDTVYRINLTVTQVNDTVTLIYNDTQYIIDLLNCNSTTDTPLCRWMIQINDTVNNIWNLTVVMNSTLTDVWNNVVLINQTVNNIEGNVSIVLNNTQTIIDLINCTNITAQWQNSTCNRLNRIENYSIDILNNITSIWNGYNVTDIRDWIDSINISANISADLTEVLTEISRLREFDEELVFLVTDSFNAQAQARQYMDSGDIGSAADKLIEAKAKLDQATLRLAQLKSNAAELEVPAPDGGSVWWIWLMLAALIAATTIYLFQRVPEEPPKEQY